MKLHDKQLFAVISINYHEAHPTRHILLVFHSNVSDFYYLPYIPCVLLVLFHSYSVVSILTSRSTIKIYCFPETIGDDHKLKATTLFAKFLFEKFFSLYCFSFINFLLATLENEVNKNLNFPDMPYKQFLNGFCYSRSIQSPL